MFSKKNTLNVYFLSKVVANILSRSVACIFIFLIVSFEEQTVKILINLIYFFFFVLFVSCLRNLCLTMSQRYSSRSSIVFYI